MFPFLLAILLSLVLPFTACIRCYICHKDISNCTESIPLGLLHECAEDVAACFTQADQILVRGCFHYQSGISLRAFTRLCTEDGCNNEPFISPSKLMCQVCTEGGGCEENLVDCKHNVILYRSDFCYSAYSDNGKTLIKGCLLGANEHIQKLCNPMDVHRDRCVTCQYNGCNQHVNPVQSTTCFSSMTKGAVDCRSYKISQRIGCFARNTINGQVERGCNTQLTDEAFQHCADVVNNTCQLCMSSSMCNDLKQDRLQTCAFGNKETALAPKVCKSAADRCVLYDAFGQFLYNCESSILCLTPFCYFCTGHMCNWNLKPYISCHACNSTKDCRQDLSNVQMFKRVCDSSKRADFEHCFSVVDDKNEIHRGCYTEEQSLCDTFSSKCVKCSDANYCNNQPVLRSSLVCFSCTADDQQCPIERSTMSKTVQCLDHFPSQPESCYEIFDELTSQVERGCSLDIPRERMRRKAQFMYCDSHFCNAAGYAVRKCLSCEGTESNSLCHRLGSDAIQLVRECETIPGKIEASKCFTLFWNETTISRGCQVELNKEQEEYCQRSADKFCYTCAEDTCNKMKLWYEKCFICVQNCTQLVGNGTEVKVEMSVRVPTSCSSISTDEKNGCFIRRVDQRELRQGCVADMTRDEYAACVEEGRNSCQICKGGSCNNELSNATKLENYKGRTLGAAVISNGNRLLIGGAMERMVGQIIVIGMIYFGRM